jgi:hypothetical protein
MRFIGRVLKIVGIAWCIGILFLPFTFLPNNIRVAGTLVIAGAFALWTVLYPQGMLELTRRKRPDIDPQDKRLQQVQRIAGVIFLIFFLAIIAVSLKDSR